ncbi:RDD family protein [Amycolatopsis sp. NPDC003865]
MTAWSAALPAEVRRYQGRRAGLVSRGLAAVVDAGVVVFGLAVAFAAWVALRFAATPAAFAVAVPARPVAGAVAAVSATGYLALCWTVTGRTAGGQLLGLRVVDARGRPLRAGRAVVRAGCCAVFPLGLLWVLADRERRSVQDVLLRTSVVYDWTPRSPDPSANRRPDTPAGPRSGASAGRTVLAATLLTAALLAGCAGRPETSAGQASPVPVPPAAALAVPGCDELASAAAALETTARGTGGPDRVRAAAAALDAVVSRRLAAPRPPAGLTEVAGSLRRLAAPAADVRAVAGTTVAAFAVAMRSCR